MRVTPLPETRPPWDAAWFPRDLYETRKRLRERVIARIDANGAIRDPCRSRVLESALGLRAVQRVGGRPQAEQRLIGFLKTQRDAADPLDRLLARTAIDESTAPDTAAFERVLDRVPGFTGARKRTTLTAILRMLGVTDGARGDAFDPEPERQGLHPWALAQSTADRVVLAAADGRSEQITAADIAILDATQRSGDVWESNLLVHLCVVHALSLLPGTYDAVTKGVDKALMYQRPDGGLPFVSDIDTWCTATGAVALACTGTPQNVLHRLAEHLTAQQHADGGWSFSDRVELCDTDDVSVALEFLGQLDPVLYRGAIDKGLRWLRRVQGPDGGFPTYPGAPSEPCMTIAAVNALTHQPVTHGAATHRAVQYMASRQQAAGTFPPDWSASRYHTLFRAVLAGTNPALAQVSSAGQLAARALDAVQAGQNPDGGWGQQSGMPSDPISTAYALTALTRQNDPTQAIEGLRYLLSACADDSAVVMVPDSIGPRPFIFTVPALADIFMLLALGHVTAACAMPVDRDPVYIPAQARPHVSAA